MRYFPKPNISNNRYKTYTWRRSRVVEWGSLESRCTQNFYSKKVIEINKTLVEKIRVQIRVKIKCLFYRSNSLGCDVSI